MCKLTDATNFLITLHQSFEFVKSYIFVFKCCVTWWHPSSISRVTQIMFCSVPYIEFFVNRCHTWKPLSVNIYGIQVTHHFTTCSPIYRVSHKKRNGGFSVACDLKVPYLFTSSNQATPAEENDTKIIKFYWVILILWPFVKTQSFSNFAWFLRLMSEGLCWEWPFIVVFWGSPLIRVNKRNTVQQDSPKHYNERLFPTYSFAHRPQKSSEIWKWPYFKKWA